MTTLVACVLRCLCVSDWVRSTPFDLLKFVFFFKPFTTCFPYIESKAPDDHTQALHSVAKLLACKGEGVGSNPIGNNPLFFITNFLHLFCKFNQLIKIANQLIFK